MENFIYKLNKYTIKLNKFINNNELIENNFDKYLLYLNKFNYYYNLTGGAKEPPKPKPKPQLSNEEKEKKKNSKEAQEKRAARAARAAKAREDITVSADSEAVFGETPTKKTRSQIKAENKAKRRAEEKREHDARNATGKPTGTPSKADEDGRTIQVINPNPEGNSSIATRSYSHSGSPHGNIPKDIMGQLRNICDIINHNQSTA
jgi:hypothetical protein